MKNQYEPSRGSGGRYAVRFGLRFGVICMVLCSILRNYCISGSGKINASRARGARARVSVNFRKFSPCMACARSGPAGLTVYPPSRTLELLPR